MNILESDFRGIYFMRKTTIYLLLVLAIAACGRKSEKFSADDPFKDIGVKSDFYEIDGSRDTVLLAEKGTVVSIPAGAFVKDEKPYTGKVTLELAEAYSLEDMLSSGLTTTSDGKLLETKGMIYMAATDGKDELKVSDTAKPYVEMPVSGDVKAFKIYKGKRSAKGEMEWTDPTPPKVYLTTVPASDLDFLPDEFSDSCRANFKLLGWDKPDMAKMEELYASLQYWQSGRHYLDNGVDINEDVLTGEHTINGFRMGISTEVKKDTSLACNCYDSKKWSATVLQLKKKEYENTFVHTRAFEQRVRYLIGINGTILIEKYTTALDKDLWQIDEQIAKLPTVHVKDKKRFEEFAAEKLTNVKDQPPFIKKLSANYKNEIASLESKVDQFSAQMNAAENRKMGIDPKVVKEYKQLLWKRESYRMEKLGFEFKGNGWYNADKPLPEAKVTGTIPICLKYWNETTVEIENRNVADRVFMYVLFDDIYSIARLQEFGTGLYHTAGLAMNVDMDCKRKLRFVALGIKDKQWFLGDAEFVLGENGGKKKMKIHAASKAEKQARLAELERFANKSGKHNSIATDLQYQEKFYTQYKANLKNKRKYDLLDNLEYLGNIDCYRLYSNQVESLRSSYFNSEFNKKLNLIILGQVIYEKNNCGSCHALDKTVVGPKLRNIRKKRPVGWLVQYIRDNDRLKRYGEPLTKMIYKEYNGATMNIFENLSDQDIKSIIYYLDHAPIPEPSRPMMNSDDKDLKISVKKNSSAPN